LIGKLFDDGGNRMSPSHARKGGIKYGYYLSSALLNGTPDRVGSVPRVPADEVERLIVKSVREHLNSPQEIDDRTLVNAHVARIQIQLGEIVVQLADAQEIKTKSEKATAVSALQIPWQKMPSKRKREILLPEGIQPKQVRPIRSENRATLVAAIARGRRWLGELMTDEKANAENIAKREGCSLRKVNMTISLAFLAPNLVTAAIEGRLPHGMGVTRLADLPAEWSRQHRILGLSVQ
jgi:site-specific DNA recombinase